MVGLHSGRGGGTRDGSGPKEVKNARVIDQKAAPETGYKRLIVRETTMMGQTSAIDIPLKEAKRIEKSQTYSFSVEEKSEGRAGGSTRKKTGFKTYMCDEAPEIYDKSNSDKQQRFNGIGGRGTKRTSFSRV